MVGVFHNMKSNTSVTSPGIYLLINKINGKMYVGKAKNLKDRLRRYKYTHKYKTVDQLIQRAIIKYGWINFKIIILEIVPINLDYKILLDIETFWIKLLGTYKRNIGYNVAIYNMDCTGQVHSDDTIQLMRNNKLGNNNPFYGKQHSKKTKQLLSKKHKGIKNLSKPKKVHQIDKYTNEIIRTWSSMREASLFISNKPNNHISDVCRGKNITWHGYKWSFCDK